MVNRNLGNMRKSYTLRKLQRSDLKNDPMVQFKSWFEEAVNSEVYEPNAMTLATVCMDSLPSCRIVLLKGIDHGFIFYTNYQSRKGQQIFENNNVAATFWWDKLERQVRIEGLVEKVDQQLSDQYFSSRPSGSQISAAASPQSQKVPSYDHLLDLQKAISQTAITRPDTWGGYRINPNRMEFWQGRQNRLHDRFVYEKQVDDKNWAIDRLAP